MSFQDHFDVTEDAISPQPWMQLRGVASVSVPSVAKSYDASDGAAKNELVQTVAASWTNNSPVPQWVYGMVTRGGAQVALQTRSRAYLKASHGVQVITSELCADPDFEVGGQIIPKGNVANGYSTDQAYSGTHSYQLVSSGAGDTSVLEVQGYDVDAPTVHQQGNGNSPTTRVVLGRRVQGGQQFYAEAMIRPKATNSVTPGHLNIGVILRADVKKGLPEVRLSMDYFVAPTAATWIKHSGVITVPNNYEIMYIVVQLGGDNPPGDTYYVDQAHAHRYIPVEAAAMVDVSRFGVGADIGKGGLLATSSAYSVAELRQNSQTMPLMPQQTGMFLVEVGDTINARVDLRFVSEYWESGNIDGGDTGTEAKFTSGDTRLDLFAVPSVTAPPPRLIPSIPGGASNVKWSREWNTVVDGTIVRVTKPAGLEVGDVLLAVVCNQFGMLSDISPVESGWALAHQRNEGLFGLGDVHLKVYARTINGAEPATFRFRNPAPVAEEIAVLIPLRGAQPFDGGNGSNWYIGSNLSRFRLVEEQKAPSIERQGQFLICLSYFNHSPTQAGISQAPPVGMTELVDIPAAFSTLAIAYLANPPFPTFDRRFTPTEIPIFFGHSIAASIVVPGLQQF